jgi:Kef-type K+ transport system membrane component KefB
MSTAAWDDVVAWCILPFVLSIITGSDYLNALWTVISLIVFVLLMFFVGRRFFAWLFHRFAPTSVTPPVFGVVIIFVMMASWVTDCILHHIPFLHEFVLHFSPRSTPFTLFSHDPLLSRHWTALYALFLRVYHDHSLTSVYLTAIFGAFIFGVILPREGPFLVQVAEKLEDVVLTLFLPIYFITSGLKTDIGSLTDGKAWGFVVLVTVVAAGSKIIGCGITARICGMTTRESLTLGVMMNSKGLVELIVLSTLRNPTSAPVSLGFTLSFPHFQILDMIMESSLNRFSPSWLSWLSSPRLLRRHLCTGCTL